MRKSLEDVRREGLEALRQRLGRAGMVRFLQQFETGRGDYTNQRREWAESVSLEDLKSLASPATTRRPRRKS